ncbi:hypothetical protein AN286_10430 (plasmid) [Aliarcobacter cryaerophilus ATCC 43158]|uniref:Uncharacterized protein n=2 Tax=Aliarcobacter cryaerophilus TaxID=28198 RepID=A0AAD0TVC9_9BACT|nr:hypothetical protein ACRYA_a0088 [Aliarcobacter cryaerophilus ATCC 43158]PRM94417.1 hypothetical protein CJ667_09960 [Aliarcobacter cryaerophilus]QCZ24874.1 hypothetical protein AN286_10430 [Aliarcobacter cryaerophilus ATCC 43158]
MLDIFRENKRYLLYIFIIFFLIILNLVYYFFDASIPYAKNTSKESKQKVESKIDIDLSEKVVKKDLEKKDFEENVENIKNDIVLFSNISEKGKYFVRISNKEEIHSEKSIVRYIVLTGDISDNDTNKDRFSLSLDENYIYNINDIKVEIENIEIKKIWSCNGTFLNTISPEFSYHIQVNLKNGIAECYIKSQSESNNGRELDNKLLNNLIKDKSIITKDGSLIDEKELEKFKKIDFN